MANARSVTVVDSSGALAPGLTPVVSAWTKDGTALSVAWSEKGNGEYQIEPTDADEAVGCLVVMEFGAGYLPVRRTWAVFKADNTNQFWAVDVQDTDGTKWTGAAPTVADYKWSDGTDKLSEAPATVAVPPSSKWLFCWTPSAADITGDASIRVAGPAGSLQPFWTDDVLPITTVPAPAVTGGGLVADMADAIALLASGTYSVTRRAAPVNQNGYLVPGSTSSFSIVASIQPAPGKALDLLPEGYRGRGGQLCYTATPLRTAQAGQVPDLVSVGGELHEAVELKTWEALGNYQAVILVRLPV